MDKRLNSGGDYIMGILGGILKFAKEAIVDEINSSIEQYQRASARAGNLSDSQLKTAYKNSNGSVNKLAYAQEYKNRTEESPSGSFSAQTYSPIDGYKK